MQKSSVLITGGAGFLGCHLARQLLKEGYHVTLLDIARLDAKDLIGKVDMVIGDVRDKKTVAQIVKGQQYVIHAAAALPIQRTKQAIYSVNVDGTKNVLEEAKKQKIKRVVYISTTAVYGIPKHLPETEESPIDPIGYYGESKVLAEKLCLAYEKKGLQVNILRPKSFLGPERLGVFEIWFEAIYTNKNVFILGNGRNLYQLLAVSDVTDAIIKAVTSKIHGKIFNIGAKDYGTWREDLGYIISNAGSKSRIVSLPALPSQLLLSFLEKLNLSPLSEWHYKTMPIPSYIAVDKAEKLLRWHPKKSNKQLLLESYHWYKINRNSVINKTGKTHRVGWDFKILHLIARL